MPVNTLNAALFFDLGGTLIKLDETRELPIDARGNVIVELLPGVARTVRPQRPARPLVSVHPLDLERHDDG